MNFYGLTDIGKRRAENEDAFYVPNIDEKLKLFIVADGMGGYAGGKLASNLAKDAVASYIKNNINTIPHEKENILELLKNSIEYSNFVVYEKSKENKEFENMGTTIAVVLIYNNIVYIGHVGDSRIYRVRKNIIRQLTKDHSFVEKLIAEGTITRQEAYNHPKKNMLMKAIGVDAFVEPDIKSKNLLKGDILLLCTDGLTNMVKDEQIFKTIYENSHDLKTICEKLVEDANNAGGYDNSTIVIIEK